MLNINVMHLTSEIYISRIAIFSFFSSPLKINDTYCAL